MPITTCRNCHSDYHWSWTEAFDKFGFGDGDGTVLTDHVADALEAAGYHVAHQFWGMHNDVIFSITDDSGRQLIPATAKVGYDNPREYLPPEVVTLLDETFPDERVLP